MRAGRMTAWLTAGCVLLMTIGCGNASGPSDPARPGGTPASTADLLGRWSVVSDAAAPDTVLVLDPGSFTLGTSFGAWHAGDGAFVAEVNSAEGAPDGTAGDLSTPAWLAAAERVENAGVEVLLRDAQGTVTARLSPTDGARPDTAGVLGDPVPLPSGLIPADRQKLLGRWVPAGGPGAAAAGSGPATPSVTLVGDGSYSGSDGCNGASGRWTSGAGGLILATGGPMTLIACVNSAAVPGWLAGAGRAGFDGEELVLIDTNGAELGRLVRA